MSPATQLRVVLLSVVASVVVIVAALAGVIALWQPSSLESIVPADTTMAVIRHGTRADIEIVRKMYASAPAFPLAADPYDAALLKLPSGSLAWIAIPSPYAVLPEANVRVGRQMLVATDASVQQLLDETDRSNSAARGYAVLSSGLSATASITYLPRTGMDALPEHIRPLLFGASGTGGLVIATDTDRTDVRIAADAPALRATAGLARALTPPADFSMEAGDPAKALETYVTAQPAAQRSVTMGRVQSIAKSALPGEWSWTYDVLPLLEGPASVHVRTENGARTFLLEANATSADDAEKLLATFHDAFVATLPGTSTRRALDKGIVSTILKSGSAAEDTRWDRSGFSARETKADDRTFVSARNGRRFIVSNSRAWADQALESQRTDGGGAMLEGSITGATARSFIGTDSSPVSAAFLSSIRNDAPMRWSIWRVSGAVGITLRPSQTDLATATPTDYPTSR
jgi:hypothetical protein